MKSFGKFASVAFLFIAAVALFSGLVAGGLWMVDRGLAAFRGGEPEREIAVLRSDIQTELARSLARPSTPEASTTTPPSVRVAAAARPAPPPECVVVPAATARFREPLPVLEVTPDYPAIARNWRVQGPVEVVVQLDPQGVPVAAQAVHGSALLREPAVRAALGWRFQPALDRGRPVPAAFRIRYQFRLA